MGRSSATAQVSPTPWPRPARSTCSKPCREADDERCVSRIDPQRPVHGIAPGGGMGDRGRRFPGRQCLDHADRPSRRAALCGSRSRSFGVKLHRSTATGWEEIPVPTYPPKPEGYEEYDMWGRPLAWSTARIWALEAGDLEEPGVLWCGTIPGGLFRSSDHGNSWEMVRALWDHPKRTQWMGGGADLPGMHSICVDPRNAKRVCVAISTGGLWFTEDAGANWSQRGEGMRAEYVPAELTHDPIAQDVHRLVQCPAAPERMWVQ